MNITFSFDEAHYKFPRTSDCCEEKLLTGDMVVQDQYKIHHFHCFYGGGYLNFKNKLEKSQ